ncbi:cupin domain-containing protein [Grimontia sedimenti]|uniref:cupin domain-containing protein n=1 Tax=Grimontia sedimenti TaxID=2711294 RepID=UPI003F672BC9
MVIQASSSSSTTPSSFSARDTTTPPIIRAASGHEEIYIFIGGQGEFMVDDNRFEVTTGSVVRVAPEGVRGWRNTSNSPLYYAVLQVKAGSETVKNTIEDGRGVNRPVIW